MERAQAPDIRRDLGSAPFPDLRLAEDFLHRLGEAPWTFQVFRDRESKRGRPWHRTGTLAEFASQLISKNKDGYGVFVTVNRCNGKGRGKADVDLVRALFVDLDVAPLEPVLECPILPHIVVESSPGHWHAYWLVTGCPLGSFDSLLDAMVSRFSADQGAKGINRVLRLPGFFHRKREPYLVRVISSSDHSPFTYAELLAEFPPSKVGAREEKYLPDRNAAAPTSGADYGFPGSDNELLQAARRAGNGTKFSRLFDSGDTSDYGDDDSSADMALCLMLAFWCGPDPVRIDRLFRESALYRKKWNQKRGDSTYGEVTIKKALAKVREFYAPSKPILPLDTNGFPAQPSLEELGQRIDHQLNTPSKGDARSKKRSISTAVTDWLLKRRRLLCDISTGESAPYVVTEDKAVLALNDTLAVQILMSYVCLNATEPAYRWILADLRTEAIKRGVCITLRRYAHVTPTAIYLSCGKTGVVRITVAGVEVVSNGIDDVWFAGEHTYGAWNLTAPVSASEIPLLCPSLVPPPEVPEYTGDRQIQLSHAWLIAAVVGLRPLPAKATLGQMGSGKTLTCHAETVVVNGAGANVITMPEKLRDAQVVLSSSALVAFDNLDGEPEKWFPDLFATAVTGGNTEVRKLYTTSDIEIRALTAAMTISSRTPQFAERSDIQDRLLPLFFGERGDSERRDDAELLDEVQRNRDGILSWIAQQAAVLLRPAATGGYAGRFQSFGRLVCELDPFTGHESLEAAYRAARTSIVDHPPLIHAILQFGKPLRGNTTEIVSTLQDKGFDIPHVGGGRKIANLIREHRHLYRLDEEPANRNGVRFHISPIKECGECGECGESDNPSREVETINCEEM